MTNEDEWIMYGLYYSPIDEESRIVIPIDILVNLKY
jgi:hypothetical protein